MSTRLHHSAKRVARSAAFLAAAAGITGHPARAQAPRPVNALAQSRPDQVARGTVDVRAKVCAPPHREAIMGSGWLYPFILFAGALQAFGAPMNAQLKNSLANPWLASAVSFGLIVAVTVVLFAVFPRPVPTSAGLEGMPWWAPVGGLLGAVAVYAGLTLVGKVGAGPFNGLVVTANVIASLAVAHFGWFHMQPHPITLWRVVGAVLMVAGVFLIAKF